MQTETAAEPKRTRKPSKRDLEQARIGELNRTSGHWALIRTYHQTQKKTGEVLFSDYALKNALTGKVLVIRIEHTTFQARAFSISDNVYLLFLKGCSCEDHTTRSRDCYHMAAYQALRDILAGLRPAKPRYRKDRSTGEPILLGPADEIRQRRAAKSAAPHGRDGRGGER